MDRSPAQPRSRPTYGLRTLRTRSELSEAEEAAFEAAVASFDELNDQYGYGEEVPADVAVQLASLESEIAEYEARAAIYDTADIAIGGAFVTLDLTAGRRCGAATSGRRTSPSQPRRVRLRRPSRQRPGARAPSRRCRCRLHRGGDGWTDRPTGAECDAHDHHHRRRRGGVESQSRAGGGRPLSEQHRTELTSSRTIALREALADNPEAAFIAVLHAMVKVANQPNCSLYIELGHINATELTANWTCFSLGREVITGFGS